MDTLFVIRCISGFDFDVIEFVIIVIIKENILYLLFVVSYFFYLIFSAVLLECYSIQEKVSTGCFSFFKLLSFFVAELMFSTCTYYGNDSVLLSSRFSNSTIVF